MRIKLIIAIIIASSLTVHAQKIGIKSIDGVKYAVIIASDGAQSGFEKRNDDDLYYNTKLYIYDGTSSPPLSASRAKKLVRHTASGSSYYENSAGGWVSKSYNPNQRVSALFAISPVDVWSDGNTQFDSNSKPPPTLYMGWAFANGFLKSADAVNINNNIPAQTTGCYMYKGVNGTDPVGTWRIPTQRELQLIWILQTPLSTVKDETSFIEFSANLYWSATESSATEAFIVDFGSGSTYIRTKSSNGIKVRCVRDIK